MVILKTGDAFQQFFTSRGLAPITRPASFNVNQNKSTVAERYALIKLMSDKHSIKGMCATLGVSRRGYYQWKNAG